MGSREIGAESSLMYRLVRARTLVVVVVKANDELANKARAKARKDEIIAILRVQYWIVRLIQILITTTGVG